MPGSPGAPASCVEQHRAAGAGTVALPSPAAQASAARRRSAPAAAPAIVVTPAPIASSSPLPSPSASASASPAAGSDAELAASAIAQTVRRPRRPRSPRKREHDGAASAVRQLRRTGAFEFESVERLGAPIRIGDVAAVTDSFEPQRQYSYVGTVPTISLGVQKATGASEITAAQNVMQALPAIERSYPDIDFRILNDQAAYTQQQLWGVFHTLIEGIAFTGIVMLFFLRSWRNALVVLIAIPTSLCVTLFVMRLVNFTIDTVSLLAMTLIIGILVDDSIVVLENVERHFEDGEAPRTGGDPRPQQIGAAAIVITLVDVVVFLPIAFLPGTVGNFFPSSGSSSWSRR